MSLFLAGQQNYRLTVVKGSAGALIDSVSVSSTFPKSTQQHLFREDSISIKVPVYVPSDKVFIDTYAKGSFLGSVECWVDEGKASVYLSVNEGTPQIDSIKGSTIDDWFLSVMEEIRTNENPTSTESYYDLLTLISNYSYELISAPFVRVYMELWPNDYRKIITLRNTLYDQQGWLRRHPYYEPLLARINLVTYNKTIKLSSFNFLDRRGEAVQKPLPSTPYTVLYFWSLDSPSADTDHQRMVSERKAGVFPRGVPFIGVCAPSDQAAWTSYLRERDIPWISYMEMPEDGRLNSDKLGILVYPTYFLINRRGRVMGIYDNYDDLRKTLEVVAASKKKE